MRSATILTAAVLLAACGGPESADGAWGAPVSDGEALALADLLADPAAFDGRTVLLEAEVDEVCRNKGCWMTFTGADETVRVTFEDYAFFVPKDLSGSTVRVEGTFEVREVPVDEARHYLEDAGRHEQAAAITEPQRGYGVVATGVETLPRG